MKPKEAHANEEIKIHRLQFTCTGDVHAPGPVKQIVT